VAHFGLPVVGAEDTEQLRERRARFFQKCALIDRYIGGILERLEQQGALENTLIVFTSDHGDMLGDFGIWDKRHFREQSVGVPLIMAGPGVPAGDRGLGGRTSRDLVSLLDLYPTFLSAAGLDPETAPRFRGRRFGLDLRAIVDPARPEGHDVTYSGLGTHAMGYNGAWKLVYDPEQGGVVQLFHLPSDPREEVNHAASGAHEAVQARLLEKLLAVRIGLSQYTHEKEQTRLQTVRAGRLPR
jgi:choline-sulfatase